MPAGSGISVSIKADKAIKNAAAKIRNNARLATANRVWAKIQMATRLVVAETPAWSGDTIANYVWNAGSRSSAYTPINQGISWRAPIFPVQDKDQYAAMSIDRMLSLRSEVYTNPYAKYVLWNNVSYEDGMGIRDLEYGRLTGTPVLMFTKAKLALSLGNG